MSCRQHCTFWMWCRDVNENHVIDFNQWARAYFDRELRSYINKGYRVELAIRRALLSCYWLATETKEFFAAEGIFCTVYVFQQKHYYRREVEKTTMFTGVVLDAECFTTRLVDARSHERFSLRVIPRFVHTHATAWTCSCKEWTVLKMGFFYCYVCVLSHHYMIFTVRKTLPRFFSIRTDPRAENEVFCCFFWGVFSKGLTRQVVFISPTFSYIKSRVSNCIRVVPFTAGKIGKLHLFTEPIRLQDSVHLARTLRQKKCNDICDVQ